MTTQEIINDMRSHTITSMRAAADRLEELQRLNDSMQVDRDLWIKVGREKLQAAEKERDQLHAEVERVKACCEQGDKMLQGSKQERDEALAEVEQLKAYPTRLEPSRLEIAAMLKAGWFANRDADFNATDHKWWVEQADALIAAARK
jgi:chromosome segregation ATPase